MGRRNPRRLDFRLEGWSIVKPTTELKGLLGVDTVPDGNTPYNKKNLHHRRKFMMINI